MKRTAILLAAVLTGSGCIIETCEPNSLTVDWLFVAPDGATTASCTAADVDWVDVWIDQAPYVRIDCFAGAVTVPDVPSGAREVVVEGIRGGTLDGIGDPDPFYAGEILYRDWRNGLAIGSCGDTWLAASPGEAVLEIDYAVTCGAGSTYMWYSLTDEISGLVAGIGSTDGCSAKTAYLCGDAMQLRLPYGPYTLDWIREVTVGAPTACVGASLSCDAGPVTAVLDGPATASLPELLPVALSSAACP